jgi:hypothetical protein
MIWQTFPKAYDIEIICTAAVVLLQEKNQAVHIMVNNQAKQQSSTFRELKAVEFVLKSVITNIRKHNTFN